MRLSRKRKKRCRTSQSGTLKHTYRPGACQSSSRHVTFMRPRRAVIARNSFTSISVASSQPGESSFEKDTLTMRFCPDEGILKQSPAELLLRSLYVISSPLRSMKSSRVAPMLVLRMSRRRHDNLAAHAAYVVLLGPDALTDIPHADNPQLVTGPGDRPLQTVVDVHAVPAVHDRAGKFAKVLENGVDNLVSCLLHLHYFFAGSDFLPRILSIMPYSRASWEFIQKLRSASANTFSKGCPLCSEMML